MSSASLKKKVEKAIKKSKKGIYAFVSKPEDYKDFNDELIYYLTNKLKMAGVYVSLTNPYGDILKKLKKRKINTGRILFIDNEGSTTGVTDENYISLEGNKSLTELSLAISAAAKNKAIKYVFLDSISTMLIYNSLETTQRFIHYFVSKIRKLGILMVVISIDEEKSNKLGPLISQFSDGYIKL